MKVIASATDEKLFFWNFYSLLLQHTICALYFEMTPSFCYLSRRSLYAQYVCSSLSSTSNKSLLLCRSNFIGRRPSCNGFVYSQCLSCCRFTIISSLLECINWETGLWPSYPFLVLLSCILWPNPMFTSFSCSILMKCHVFRISQSSIHLFLLHRIRQSRFYIFSNILCLTDPRNIRSGISPCALKILSGSKPCRSAHSSFLILQPMEIHFNRIVHVWWSKVS